jgi:hypothetical protein
LRQTAQSQADMKYALSNTFKALVTWALISILARIH